MVITTAEIHRILHYCNCVSSHGIYTSPPQPKHTVVYTHISTLPDSQVHTEAVMVVEDHNWF